MYRCASTSRRDQTWGVPVYAALDLVDKQTGKVLSSATKLKVATLPKATELGSFIVGGKHYQVDNQLRRKPGVYVTERSNHELRTDINIAGRPFGIDLDSKSGIFYLTKGQGRQPLYPLLSRMGISDSLMAKSWGADLLEANKVHTPSRAASAVKKTAEFFLGQPYDSPDAAAKDVRDYLAASKLAPEVTRRTLGDPIDRVTPDVLVRGAEELLRATKAERAPDDRQSIEYKKILSVADFLKERLVNDAGAFQPRLQELRRKIAARLNNRSNLPNQIGRVLSSNEIGPLYETFFTQSDLSHTPEQTNPLHILNGLSRVTLTGEGGIQSEHGIKDEERMIHPSHLGFLDPIHTPEGPSIGVVTTLPMGVAKGGSHDLRARFYDPKSRTYRNLSPSEMRDHVIAFPDQFKHGAFVDRQVKALVQGEPQYVDAADVDLVLPNGQQAFSVSTNMIPFLTSAAGSRGLPATKMLEQALPLVHREAPLVQVALGSGTMERHVGDGFAIRAQEDGVVDAVTPKGIHVRTARGRVAHPLYDHVPLNYKSFLHATPRVSEGERVAKGQLLADSNFTAGGDLALGTNLRAAYLPYKGYNFEDGIVITENAARKLTSEHLHQFADDLGRSAELSTKQYVAWRPGDLTLEQQGKLDDAGVVKKGQILRKGDPMWVGAKENLTDPDSIVLSKLTRLPPKRAFKETWDSEVPGEVVDVVRDGRKVKVYVKTLEPAQVGDKLTNRHGAKGIVTKIIPDGEAPRDAAGRPVEILLNTFGIHTRLNASQLPETMAGKAAEKSGHPYVVDNFSDRDHTQEAASALAKVNLQAREPLFDPHTGKKLGDDVLVGPQYILKLTKQATSQFSARSEGKYDINRAPLKGGDEGSKAIDLLTLYSMLAHGARANLREMATTYKASRNDPFWDWLAAGPALGLVKPPPEPTFAYKKFEAYLKGAGVNVERRGSKMVLQPMTDREVERLSSGPVQEPLFLRAKDLQKVKGGFVDPIIFGANEDRWGHIDLAEPLPNPVFEEPVKTLTGLSTRQYDGLVRGQLFLDPATGQWSDRTQGLTGGNAIRELLRRVDVDAELKTWTERAKTATRPTELDRANKRLKYLAALKKLKLRPEEAYVQTKLPVLPPQFRPVTPLPDGSLSVQGANWLYRDLGLVNNELHWQKSVPFIPESAKAELREHLYEGSKALAGLGDPIAFYPPKRRPKGFIDQLSGDKAKTGFFQQDVLRRKQNLVGRGTIIPEPKLGVDEVGLPEEMAWQIFKPFTIRELVGLGHDPKEALDEFERRTPAAKAALAAAMNDRPVLLNRAPSLHKFSIMAFRPKITEGRAVKIPPLVVKGFNADFDGDAMTVHVPLLPDAVEEAKRMLPSKHLYNPGTGAVAIAPQNEAALGLYLLSQDPARRKEVLDVVPDSVRAQFKEVVLDAAHLKSLLGAVAKVDPIHYGKVVDQLKELGDRHAYETGFSVGPNDLRPDLPERAAILREAEQKVRTLLTGKVTPEKRAQAVEVVRNADAEIKKILPARLGAQGNNFFRMVASGARGNVGQLQQLVAGPVLTDDHRGHPMPIPVTRSFAEGLPFSEYWQTLYGARRVAIDKQLQTQNPGAFNKDVLATSATNVVSTPDCKTTHGIHLSVSEQGRDVEDRFLAKDVQLGSSVVARAGDLVTPGLLQLLRDRHVKEIEVRSPLTCIAPKGTCAKCYGLHESGSLPSIGENVGVLSGQALSEPLTQMTLRTFHSGGASGSRGVITGYEKIDKMLKMPRRIAGKATLARSSGQVDRIEPAPGGVGQNIWIAGTKHFVPKDVFDPSKIKVGSRVEKGDALSLGVIKPEELQELKGMLPALSYVADQVQGAYAEQGIRLKRRAIETVLRSVGNTTKVLDPGDSDFLPGDVAPFTVVEDYNRRTLGKKPIAEAVGHELREPVGDLQPGTILNEHAVRALERLGKHEVAVGPKSIVHRPMLKGITQLPLMRDDWMARLGYHHIKDTIVRGAHQAQESDIHDYSPIPAFAYGAEFGEGTEGRY